MTLQYCNVSLLVWGDRMCCSAPWGKPDNFSFPFLTPTAARGICDSIYFDRVDVEGGKSPTFHYMLRRIVAVEHPNPAKRALQGTTATMMLNGVENKITYKRKIGAYKFKRRQRYITFIQFPAFRVDAAIVLVPSPSDKSLRAHEEIFNRRVRKQQSYREPHLGLAMFPAQFGPVTGDETVLNTVNWGPGALIYDCIYNELTDRMLTRRYIWTEMKNGVLELDWTGIGGRKELIAEQEKRRAI